MENTGTKQSALSNEDVAKYIRPITSIVAYEANNLDSLQIVMRKLDLVRIHARSILKIAKNTNTSDDGDTKSIFSILEGAFGENISGWSLVGKQSSIIKTFITIILSDIQSKNPRSLPDAVNESQIKIAA